jgi:alpha-1,2-mannosyltransferase
MAGGLGRGSGAARACDRLASSTPARLFAAVGLVVLNLISVWHQVVLRRSHSYTLDRYRIDLDVYRIGASVWRSAGDLYATMRPTRVGVSLPFTYPPIAAVLLSPLTFVPYVVATVGVTVASIVMLAVVVVVFLRATGVPRRQLMWGLGAVMPVALFIEPVQANLSFGQVNVALMLLVTLDCLLPRTRWPRGVLVGIAAATKLTPALFIVFFLVRRDLRSARNAAASFVVTTGIGFLLAWHSSVKYWTGTVFDSSRIGGVGFVGNQSVQSVLARAGLFGPLATLLWIVLSVGVLALAAKGMSRAFESGQAAPALVLNASAVLLISPISWTHHWVWIVPALMCLVALAWRARIWTPLVLAAAGLAVFCTSPQWKLPQGGDRELAWSWGEQLVGSCYVWFGAAVLVYAATSESLWADRRARSQSSDPSDPSDPSDASGPAESEDPPSVRWRNALRASG